MDKSEFAKFRFLIVDANYHSRRILKLILAAQSCREIYESENSASAVENIDRYSPNIVIAELSTPPFDAIMLAKIVGSAPRSGARTSVVLMSAAINRQHVLDARNVGVEVILVKPISPKILCDRLNYIARQFRKIDSALPAPAMIEQRFLARATFALQA